MRSSSRFWFWRCSLVVMAGVWSCSWGVAQARPVSGASAWANSALGAGDVISISVLGHVEASSDTLTIPASGRVDLAYGVSVFVAGKTPSQAARAIAQALSRELVSPDVTVALKQPRARRVSVLGVGAVNKAGVYDIGPDWRVSTVLASAGGLATRVDETSATLTHPDGRVYAIDLNAILNDPASPKNFLLQPGDVLTFKAQDPKRITITGDVQKPGAYELRRAPRLLDALTLAEGTKEDIVRVRATLYRRNGERLPLDLAGARQSNRSDLNVALQDGDTVVVETEPLIGVTVNAPRTFVASPGLYKLLPDAGVAQAVAQAGGLLVTPDQIVATILRGREIIPVDLSNAGIDPLANIALRDGDVVNIAEPKIIRVAVAGSVVRPGSLRVRPQTTLFEALTDANGLSIRPEDARISILRTGAPAPPSTGPVALGENGPNVSGASVISVDATALFANDARQNPALQDGDLVSVTPIKRPTVIVTGQVLRPGPYEVNDGEGIAQLLARAGGQTPEAALSRVVLQRRGTTQTLNALGAVNAGQKLDVTLQDGDTLIVPENTARVIVANAVQKPGPILIPEGRTLTVLDALGQAGGPRDRAAVKNVALLRPDPSAPRGVQIITLDLGRLRGGDLSQNAVMRAGDVLYVPEARASTTSSLLGSAGQFIGTLLGLRYLAGV